MKTMRWRVRLRKAFKENLVGKILQAKQAENTERSPFSDIYCRNFIAGPGTINDDNNKLNKKWQK